MKLVTEYSCPLKDKLLKSFSTYPMMINEKNMRETINEFLDQTTQYMNIPGFNMSIRVED